MVNYMDFRAAFVLPGEETLRGAWACMTEGKHVDIVGG